MRRVLRICFGGSGPPAQRDCTEAHGNAHFHDIDRDRDVDLIMQFEVWATDIDPGDTTACAI